MISDKIRHPVSKTHPFRNELALLLLITIAVIILSLMMGRYPKPGVLSLKSLLTEPLAQTLVFNLRLPRILAACLLGMSLASAGLVFQSFFSNPIVEPGFLGVSSGAAFGAAFAIIVFGSQFFIVQTSAIIFGLLGLFLSFQLARKIQTRNWIIRMILAGIMVSAFFTAGLGILKYIADPLSQLPEITFWLLGGLWSITWQRLLSVTLPVLLGLLLLYTFRWRINVLSMDEQIAFSSGVRVNLERNALLVFSVIMVASMISISGIVNWVGLLVPHIARRFFGGNANHAIPASMLLGAIFTVLCDTLARTISPAEIPLGIITALSGSCLFIIFITSPKKSTLGADE